MDSTISRGIESRLVAFSSSKSEANCVEISYCDHLSRATFPFVPSTSSSVNGADRRKRTGKAWQHQLSHHQSTPYVRSDCLKETDVDFLSYRGSKRTGLADSSLSRAGTPSILRLFRTLGAPQNTSGSATFTKPFSTRNVAWESCDLKLMDSMSFKSDVILTNPSLPRNVPKESVIVVGAPSSS